MNAKPNWYLVAFGVVSLLIFFGINGAILAHALQMRDALVNGSYYVMLALTACSTAVFLTYIPWRDIWSVHRKELWWSMAVGIGFTLLLFKACPPDYRVLSDETNLLSVSRSMLRNRTIHNTTMANYYLDFFKELRQVLDKRPLLFPFLMSVIHGVIGYSWKNMFVLNGMISAVFLSLVFYVSAVGRSLRAGWFAVSLIAIQPLYVLCASSGGFELLAAVAQFGLFWMFYQYMQRPTSNSLTLLWMCAVLFVNSRYEAGVIAIVLLFGLAWHWRDTLKFALDRWWLYSTTLLFSSPIVWQVMLKGSDQESGDKKPWSVAYVWEHFLDWIQANFGFDAYYPFATPVSYLALIALLWWLKESVFTSKMRYADKYRLVALFILAAALVVQFLAFLSYHAGSAVQPYAVRYFLPTCLAMSLGLGAFLLRRTWFKPKYGLVASGFIFVAFAHIAHENKFMNTLELVRKTRRIYEVIASYPPHETLVIVDRPGQYAVLDFSAMSHDYLEENIQAVERDIANRLYTSVIFIQDIDINSKAPVKGQAIPAHLPVQIIYEMRTSSSSYTRISKMILR